MANARLSSFCGRRGELEIWEPSSVSWPSSDVVAQLQNSNCISSRFYFYLTWEYEFLCWEKNQLVAKRLPTTNSKLDKMSKHWAALDVQDFLQQRFTHLRCFLALNACPCPMQGSEVGAPFILEGPCLVWHDWMREYSMLIESRSKGTHPTSCFIREEDDNEGAKIIAWIPMTGQSQAGFSKYNACMTGKPRHPRLP